MAGVGTIERLRTYLCELPPQAWALLIAELEGINISMAEPAPCSMLCAMPATSTAASAKGRLLPPFLLRQGVRIGIRGPG